MIQKFLVFAETVCAAVSGDDLERIGQLLQALDFRGFVCCLAGFGMQQLNALGSGFQCRCRAGEQTLLHANALQLLLLARAMLATLGELHSKQSAVGRFFLRAGGLTQAGGSTLLKVCCNLVLDVFLKPTHYQAFAFEVVWGVVVRVRNGGRVEQCHERGKAAGRAIVGGG